ncbi:hypothetical protein [Roseateles asaccharophilus]|uniref:Uncharacterized protein n=1 Tax=Roseateles asaccharophilus TaxID=582607 RepID=A0ABU2A3S6_9BURK|nr:hypothetical protein [Roseateles asaccharophilus]MDR7331765.1 hypothetical protein [Roseateles asaccharophilus]
MKLNIKTRAAADTATIDLLDGQGEPLMTEAADGAEPQPVTVTLYGPGSKQHAAAVAASQTRALKFKRDNKGREPTPEERTAEQARLLADVTVGFGNLAYADDSGRELEGRELALAVYGDTTLGFIAERVNRASVDWSVFTKPSSRN